MATPAPSPSASNPSTSMDQAIQQFAASQSVPSSNEKPSIASTTKNYGPLSRPVSDYEHGSYLQNQYVTKNVTASVKDLSNEYYGWSDTQKGQFRAKLGLIDKSALTAPDSTIAQAWGDYVQQSANYLAGGVTVTPFDILSKDIATKSSPAASLAGKKTQTTTDTSLTSRVDADAIFKSAAQSLLGRAPTANESAAFASLLNSQESANPTKATITTTTNDQGDTTDTQRTTTGGVSSAAAQLIAQNQANKNPEAGAYQAATTYMGALMNLVKGT